MDTRGRYRIAVTLLRPDPLIERLTLVDDALDTTPEHPFFTEEQGWLPAGSLWVGEHIFRADGGWGAVQGLVEERRPQMMVNLTIDTAHTFFVGKHRLLVHNTCDQPGPPPIPFSQCIGPWDVATIAPYIESRLKASGTGDRIPGTSMPSAKPGSGPATACRVTCWSG